MKCQGDYEFRFEKNYNLEQENKIYNGYQRSHTYFNYNQNMHDRAIIPSCPHSAPLSRKKVTSVMSLENTRKMWKRRNISRFSLAGVEDNSMERTLTGFLKIKTECHARHWTKFWVVLDYSTISFFHAQTDINPVFHMNIREHQIMPGDCYTRQRYAFRCVGPSCDLLISCNNKEDLVKWMNAAGLAAIGYNDDHREGVGIRKNRYKNCSIRIYRRTFREMAEMSDQEKLEDSVSSHSSVLSDSNSEESIRAIRKQCSIQTSMISIPNQSEKDDIMQLVDYVDITSGLTRKQTMKRRAEELAPDPVLNELLHRQLQNERQLKALLDDLNKIDELLNVDLITSEAIGKFELDHSDTVPELHQNLKDDMINCSISTGSDSSSFGTV